MSDLDAIHSEIDACFACRISGKTIIKSTGIDRGGAKAGIMVIGVAPGKSAQKAGKAFAGTSFTNLLKWFRWAGFTGNETELRQALYLTSLNKCGASPDKESNRRELWIRCQVFLWRQINALRPKLIIVLGREAAAATLNDKRLPLGAVLAKRLSGEEVAGQTLFPEVNTDAAWLFLPHPSGLSHAMNSAVTANRVISSLRGELLRIGFPLSEFGGPTG